MSGSFNPYHKWFGIPLVDQPPNHYRLLGLELYEDSQSKIEDAVAAQVEFLQALSMGEHVEHAQRILSEVALARLCLVNPERKREYDQQLRNPVDPVISAKPIPMATPIDASFALEDLKLALEIRKPSPDERQPDSEVHYSAPTQGKKTWLVIPVGAVVCLAAVLIGVFWFNGPSKQQLAQKNENQVSQESAPEPVALEPVALEPVAPEPVAPEPDVKKLEAEENRTSVVKTENKPREKSVSNKTNPAQTKPKAKPETKKPLNPKPDSNKPVGSAAVAMAKKRAMIKDALNTNLVAYWPLNDGPANTTVTRADDIIDDANHGATDAAAAGNGDTWVIDADRNRIVLSTNERNRLNAGTQDIDLNKGFSWSLWAKVASSNITDQGADVLIGTRSGAGRNTPWHKLGNGGTSGWATIGGYQLADDTWHHIAYVGDAAEGVSLYIDGKLIGTDKTPAAVTYNGRLEIGGSSQFTEDITALISDVAIWDKRLSEAQIQSLADGASVLATSAEAGIVIDDFAAFSLPGQGGVYRIDLGKVAPTFDASSSDKLVVMTGNRGSGGQSWGKDLTGISYGTNAMVEAVKLKSGDQGNPEEVAGIYYLDNPGSENRLTISYSGKMSSLGGFTILALSGTAEGVSASGSSVTAGMVTTTSTSLTTTVDGSLLLAAGVADSKNPTPASPQNSIQIGNSSIYGASGQMIVTAGRVTPAFSMSSANTPITVAAAFAPALAILDANPAKHSAKPDPANPTVAKPNIANSSLAKPKPADPKSGVTTKVATTAPNEIKGFKSHVELPPLDDVAEVKIDDLNGEATAPLEATLYFEPSWSKSRDDFQIRKSTDEDRHWIISRYTSKADSSVDVANLWVDANALSFRWLPAAQQDEEINYLRNGVLKLSTTAETVTWRNFRPPVVIEAFQFSGGDYSIKQRSELEWLPSSKDLQIELLPFQLDKIETHCTPNLATTKPAQMFFTKQQDQAFLSLELDGSVRQNRLTLEAVLKLSVSDRRGKTRPQTFDSKLLSSQIAFLNQAIGESTQTVAAIKDANQKKQMQAVVDQAKKTLAVFKSYQGIVAAMNQQSIGVEVFYEIDGHRVVIAKTGMQARQNSLDSPDN